MLKPYLPLAAMTALLTAAATVAQPQTTTGSDASNTAGQSTSSDATATGTNSSTSGTSTSDTSGTSDSTSSASGGAVSTTATTGSLQGQDATFLRKAVEGDRMEIASAQAALDSAQRTDTKNAARMILQDHQASSQKLQALASRKGWTLPDASDAAAESDQAMNTAAGSGSFDDRFMAEQIRMHREAISLYRAQASSGADPDLRQFARDQLPHLEHHLEMLQGSNTQK
jgi:putative membrane protein